MKIKHTTIRNILIVYFLLGFLFYFSSAFLNVTASQLYSFSIFFYLVALVLYIVFIITLFKNSGFKFFKKILSLFLNTTIICVTAIAVMLILNKIGSPLEIAGEGIDMNGFVKNKLYFSCSSCVNANNLKVGEVVDYHKKNNSSKSYIGRIASAPGDLLSIRDQKIFINQTDITEKYGFSQIPAGVNFNKTLDSSNYLVLFDRNNSLTANINGEEYISFDKYIVNISQITGIIK